MIESREAAEHISKSILSINDQLEDSVRKIQKDVSPDELMAYKRGVGYVLFEIFGKILNPLYARHPELKPPGWDEEESVNA